MTRKGRYLVFLLAIAVAVVTAFIFLRGEEEKVRKFRVEHEVGERKAEEALETDGKGGVPVQPVKFGWKYEVLGGRIFCFWAFEVKNITDLPVVVSVTLMLKKEGRAFFSDVKSEVVKPESSAIISGARQVRKVFRKADVEIKLVVSPFEEREKWEFDNPYVITLFYPDVPSKTVFSVSSEGSGLTSEK